MKSQLISRASILSITIMAIFLTVGCSRKIKFSRSTVVPAAEGVVKIKSDQNKNYTIQVRVSHLAHPDNLPFPASTYVVWMNTTESHIKNIGQLKINNSVLSKSLTASIKTTSPFQPNKIFITAESQGAILHPSGQTILTTSEF